MQNADSINAKIEAVKRDFVSGDWEQKYEKIIEYGKAWPGLEDSLKIEDLKVKGCQSQVWIKADVDPVKKTVIFRGDSDAIIVKGLVAIVLKIYSNETPETIMKTEPIFLKDMGFDSGLSPSRTNGLYSMIKQIKYYATAFQYLLSK
ncbi:SufE family protein [bacterium]|nr:SufE family protein [bacterium]